MEAALFMLQTGCDKNLDEEFVYWVSPEKTKNPEEATRVQTVIDDLEAEEKKNLQKEARAVVEQMLRPVLATVPVFMKDSWPEIVHSWCEEHLYGVFESLMSQEKVLAVFRDGLPGALGQALTGSETRKAMVEMVHCKGDLSVGLLLAYIDIEFESFVRGFPSSLQSLYRAQKEKWIAAEAPAIMNKYLTSRGWLIAPLLRPEEVPDSEAAAKAWQLFTNAHADDLAEAVSTLNAAAELRCAEALANVPTWMGDAFKAKCRMNLLKEQYFVQMMETLAGAGPSEAAGSPKTKEMDDDETATKSDTVESPKKKNKIDHKRRTPVGELEAAPRVPKATDTHVSSPAKRQAKAPVEELDGLEYTTAAEMLETGMRDGAAILHSKLQLQILNYTESPKSLALTGMDQTMLVQLYVDKEQMPRVLKLVSGSGKSGSDEKVVLEVCKGKTRCSDGQPSTHTKLEILKDTIVTKAKPEPSTLEAFDPSTFATKYFLNNYEVLLGLSVPSVVTFQGVVYKIGTSGSAAQDKSVQSVYLQDGQGDLLKVVFHDNWAEGRMVVVYARERHRYSRAGRNLIFGRSGLLVLTLLIHVVVGASGECSAG